MVYVVIYNSRQAREAVAKGKAYHDFVVKEAWWSHH